MSVQTIANLPAARKGSTSVAITQAGEWVSANVDLQKLARSLSVDQETAFTDPDEPVRAVPDPWAQARSFGEALLSSDHSQHRQSLGRWRGLLALMALQDRRSGDYVLSPLDVQLSDSTMFGQVMTTLTPEVALTGCAPFWRSPTLVMVADPVGHKARLPLGMTNPVCLVSPGRSSHKIVVPNVYWAQGDLRDPLDAEAGGPLGGAELALLAHWLEFLRSALDDHDGPVANSIQNLLLAFAHDCRAGSPKIEGSIRPSIENKVPMPFRHLWNTPQLEDTREPWEKSHLRVQLPDLPMAEADKDSFERNFKGLIFADSSLAETPGISPNQTIVWGNYVLSEVLASPDTFDKVRKEAAAQGYWLVSADDLFTQRAVQLGNKAQIASHPAGLQNMVLPLRPLALMVAGELKEAVQGSANQNRAAVTLRMRVGNDGDGKTVQVTRHYSTAPQDSEGLMVIANDWAIYNAQVWPDFKSSAWGSYLARFLYPSRLKGKMARPSQAVSRALILQSAARARDSENAIDGLRHANCGETVRLDDPKVFKRAERLTGEGNNFTEEVQFSCAPYEALLYKEGQGDARSEAVAGMVLLGLKDIARPSNSSKVAVDFGTTNTVACFGDRSAQPVTFKERVVLPILVSDQALLGNMRLAHRLSLSSMMPTDDRSTPIPSVARALQPYDAKETLWAFRNLIYFHVASPPAVGGEVDDLESFRESTQHAQFNLKWDPDERRREAATDFLTQFMVMISAELVNANVDPASSTWYFSVPEAMSSSARNAFRGSLDEAVQRISRPGQTPGIAELQSEGLSAACYMLDDPQFVTDDLNIILDIGGGTTDVTIWDREEPVWKGSFYLAGQNFFTRLLCENTDILNGIGLETWAKILDKSAAAASHTPESRRSHLAEMLFSNQAVGAVDNLQAAINDHWSNRLSARLGEPLRHAGQVYLGGVAWYLGKVVRQLIDNGTLPAERASRTAFAVCGRGGGLFKKMHGSAASVAATDVTKTLNVFNKAAGLGDVRRPSFGASSAAKLEVVRGMLTQHGLIETDAGGLEGKRTEAPMGLGVTYGDNSTAQPDDLVPAKPSNARVEKIDLAEFEAFLASLDEEAGLHVDLKVANNNGGYRRMAAAVRSTMDTARKAEETGGKASSRQRQEAPFIIALRALVDLLAMAATERQDVVSTEAEE